METVTTNVEQTRSLEDRIAEQAKHAFRDVIREKLGGYSSPLNGLIESVVNQHQGELRSLLDSCISGLSRDEAFVAEVQAGCRARLAKLLVDRFGGEMEKQVNALKSDPTTRARITLAIEQIAAKGAQQA